jgi:hypothetical protein
MKKVDKLLITVAAVITVLAVVSRITIKPVSGIEARAMVGFAALLLLFAIALKEK